MDERDKDGGELGGELEQKSEKAKIEELEAKIEESEIIKNLKEAKTTVKEILSRPKNEEREYFTDAEAEILRAGFDTIFMCSVEAQALVLALDRRESGLELTEKDVSQILQDTARGALDTGKLKKGNTTIDSIFDDVMEAINSGLKIATENFRPASTPRLTVKTRLDKLDFPLDKVNSKMWNLLETDTGAQLKFAVEKAGSKKQLNVIYSIDFEEAEQAGLRISKKLDAFDKRVYIAAASLYAHGTDTVTIGQIYNAMGYDGTPGAKDREKINNSLSKMQTAHIFIDNQEEANAYKGYEYFRYDGYLLPLERVSRIVNGVFVDGVIHLLKEPPMYTFAKNRRQITTIQRTLLQTPLSKTNTNLLLEDYLIERIARAKTGKGQKKILYKTVCDNTGITSAKQRQRAKSKITQLLDYYQSTGYIKGYKIVADGVIVDP